MENEPARSEYKKVWSALSTTPDQAKLHVIGVTEEVALQLTETVRHNAGNTGRSQRPPDSTGWLKPTTDPDRTLRPEQLPWCCLRRGRSRCSCPLAGLQ